MFACPSKIHKVTFTRNTVEGLLEGNEGLIEPLSSLIRRLGIGGVEELFIGLTGLLNDEEPRWKAPSLLEKFKPYITGTYPSRQMLRCRLFEIG